jgi:aminoglycoside phosphotransferase
VITRAISRDIIMKRIGIGRTAEVYDHKDNKVLKLFYSTVNDKDIEYEYLITKNISDVTGIVPKVYDVINVKDRKGIVYEKLNGEMLSDHLSRNLKNARKIVHKFAQIQKRLNNINSENIPNHTNKLEQKIMSSSLLCDPEKEIILKYLKMINRDEICHGDYHPENVFVDQNYNFRVIDWANMFVSNKYMDIARTYYLIKLGKSLNGKSRPGELIEWLGRQFITKLYWEEVKTGENREKYFLPCLFIVILIRYDENIEPEKKWIHNYIMKNKRKVLENME